MSSTSLIHELDKSSSCWKLNGTTWLSPTWKPRIATVDSCLQHSVLFAVRMRMAPVGRPVGGCPSGFPSGSRCWRLPCHFSRLFIMVLEWSAIWSEIIRVISKSHERAHDPKFNCHFIRFIFKSLILIAKFSKQWLFCLLFSCNAESQSHCKDNQWFQNGFNKRSDRIKARAIKDLRDSWYLKILSNYTRLKAGENF